MRAFLSKVGWAGLASLAAAAVIAVAMVRELFPLASDMPHWDQWAMVPVFEAHYGGRPVLPLLLSHYNGHYNCLARALFYGMGLLSRWDTRLEVLVGFLWAAGALAVLLRMLWEASPRLLVLAAPFAAWVFSVLQFANLLNGWGMGQLLCGFAALLSLYLLTDPRAGRLRFGLAITSGVAAFLSHGAGLALAPAGLAALFFAGPHRNRARLAAWGGLMALGVGLGALGGRNTHLVVHWRRVPAFALALLGRPLTFDLAPSPQRTAMLGGLVVTALCAVLAWRAWREGEARRELLVRWGCVALLAVAVAALVAANRSAAPLDWALSAHYTTSTYPLGLALLVLVADRLHVSMSSAPGAGRWRVELALAACSVAPVAQQAVAAQRILPTLRSWKEVDERISRRLAVGSATDEEILHSLHTGTDEVRRGVALFRSRRLAWFAHAPEVHRPFGALDRVSGRPPSRAVVLRQGSTWVFEGWAVPPLLAVQTPVEAVLVIDGATVAAVRPDRPRPDRVAYFGSSSFLSCGFVLVAPDGARRPPGRYAVRIALRAPKRTTTLRTVEMVVVR